METVAAAAGDAAVSVAAVAASAGWILRHRLLSLAGCVLVQGELRCSVAGDGLGTVRAASGQSLHEASRGGELRRPGSELELNRVHVGELFLGELAPAGPAFSMGAGQGGC